MDDSTSLLSRRLSVSTVGQLENGAAEGGLLMLSWWDIKYSILKREIFRPSFFRRIFTPKKAKQEREANFQKPVEILKGVVGEVRPGQMIALMGSSGAGKTTLLNILAGRIVGGTPSGIVKVNGKSRDPKQWRKITSYVEQFDLLDGNLTVGEMIHFAAQIKLPDSLYTSKEKESKAEKLINALGLNHIANVRINDGRGHQISGGQMKRVSIAIELISEKKLIFLDEPTTGLDATTSISLINTIRNLVEEFNLSAIMSIHQPRNSILEVFDRILLLSQGKTIFFGTVNEILCHFESNGFKCHDDENPADFSTPEDSIFNSIEKL
jgi:ABC-type multidrug transport system ATPase subunit